MRSRSITFLLACLMTLFGLVLLSAADRPLQAQGENLLQNPGFEAGVFTFNPDDYQWVALYPTQREDCKTNQGQYLQCNTANVPISWIPWWISQTPADPDWKNRMPEYKPARPPFVNRIRSGNEAAQYFSFFGTHTAGLLQVVTVPVNATLRFSIWGQAWSTVDDSAVSNQPTTVNMRIGIDPLGGTNPYSSSIVWSDYQQPYDVYSLFTVEAQAQGDKVTVFTFSAPAEQRKHNDIYWDDAELVVIGGGEAPPPTSPPAPPAPPAGGNAGGGTGQTGGTGETGGGPVAQVPPANQPSPTPNAEGLILDQVQPGDSFWSIAARNGLTLDEIYELNGANEGTVIKVGDMLIVGRVDPPAPEEPEEVEEEVTAAGEELADEEDATEEEDAAEEAEPTPEPTPEPTVAAGGTICLSAFDDPNQNGLHDAGEALKASVAFTISTNESVVTNYVTDGFSEPYCIRGLEPGNYRITRSVAENENLTTQGDWAVSVSNGSETSFEFGSYVEEAPTEVAEVSDATGADAAGLALADSGAAERTVEQAEDGPGLGRILVIAAVIVVALLLLGVGVLVLSSRRSTV